MQCKSLTLRDGRRVKLGRIPPKTSFNAGSFRVNILEDGTSVVIPRLAAHYIKANDKDAPPASIDYSAKALPSLARMYLNDSLGDCVIAGKGHSVGIWSGNEEGNCILATDDEIQSNYTSICGAGDQGCVISDVLDAMKAGKFIMNGKPAMIDNYVSVDNSNQNLVCVALEVFGALTIGVNLTDDCTNAGPGVVWNFTGSIVGGHDITIYAYDSKGVYISTWAKIGTLIPWSVMTKVVTDQAGVSECYAPLSPNWYDRGNLAPNGINAATLAADLALVGGGTVPPQPGPTPVPPVPVPPVPPGPTPPVPVPPIPSTVIPFAVDYGSQKIYALAGWTLGTLTDPPTPIDPTLLADMNQHISSLQSDLEKITGKKFPVTYVGRLQAFENGVFTLWTQGTSYELRFNDPNLQHEAWRLQGQQVQVVGDYRWNMILVESLYPMPNPPGPFPPPGPGPFPPEPRK